MVLKHSNSNRKALKKPTKVVAKSKSTKKVNEIDAAPLNALMASFLLDTEPVALVDEAAGSREEFTHLSDTDKQLLGTEFRKLNEKLYTSDADDNFKWIAESPETLNRYHRGYRSQVETWSVNPLDMIIERIETVIEKQRHKKKQTTQDKYKTIKIVDMGCGEANLAQALDSKDNKIKVTSYDMHALNDRVTVANIKNLPDEDKQYHFGVLCLALMGNDWPLILLEANRVLSDKGTLFLAETTSRLTDRPKFIKSIRSLGWNIEEEADPSKFFVIYRLRKVKHVGRFGKANSKGDSEVDMKKVASMPSKLLKPCLYKKR